MEIRRDLICGDLLLVNCKIRVDILLMKENLRDEAISLIFDY